MTTHNRRSFVVAVGAVGTLGLAGCLSGDDDDSTLPEADDPSDSDSDTGSDDNGGDNGDDTDDDTDTDTDNLPDLPGDVIDGFEDLDDWITMIDRGSLEAGTDDPYAGTQSARLTADEDTDSAAIYRVVSDGLDLQEKALSLAVKFSGHDQLRLTLELHAPNSQNARTLRRTLTGPTDRWVRVDFGTTRVTTEPDLSDVREIRVVARRRGTNEGTIDCQVDDLRAIDRPETGSVMMLFDGTLESHYTHAFELMNAYDYAGVEAVIPEAVGDGDRLTIDELYELDDAGWDMAARPRTGARNLDDYTPEEQDGMIRRTKRYLENRGFEDGANHFVTPRDVLGSESIDLVREHHEQAFRYGGGPNGLPTTDPHNIGVFSGDAGEETRDYIDFAAEHGQLAVLHFEHIGEDGMSEDEFEDLLEYIDDSDVRVLTATELLEQA